MFDAAGCCVWTNDGIITILVGVLLFRFLSDAQGVQGGDRSLSTAYMFHLSHPVVYQHPQHRAVIVQDLDTRPGGPYPLLSPESKEMPLLRYIR